MKGYALVAFVAAVATWGLTWAVLRFALRFHIYPAIRARDVHTRPTPRLGGVAIFIGIMLGLFTASRIEWFSEVFRHPGQMAALAAASLLIVFIGVFDDLYDMVWYAKLAGQFLAAGILTWQGFQIVSLPIGGTLIGSGVVSALLTTILIVLTMNAVNFIDGLDGLVAGVILLASGVFFLYVYLLTVRTSPTDYFNLATLVAALLIGGCVGFLPWNWHPAKIFMGDSGAMLLGMLLAVSAISVTGQIDPQTLSDSSVWLPLLVPVVVLSLPFVDFALAVIRRVGAGKSPFSPDRKHLHHRLLGLGHNTYTAVAVFYSWTIVLSLSCFLFMVWPWPFVVVFAVIGILCCIVLTFWPVLQPQLGWGPPIPNELQLTARRIRKKETA
ncbi:undecaprenyl/decaprenyl-phosphate alpha-N-acetylglucosaminyl 1-phosphate transferase [Pseudoclavibacter sp. CFCC 14310]|uniref:MraY family glycosyltransferase n=1 Tax=Pseudoclavibacter sp. CFCC 14310 TaxID=2615180 RepID=UPI0013017B78|nr:MraY family glycosyltransferase [Pseudoclavibacter sp. CFCC 14310]KAB1643742.1 undecaprenyl/decaprenyl-phosphate alpha-N-acetylglucosaminyl 1-phosphate transferase [Pseudoclavibacter sp. CFCC 14310]